MRVLLLSMLVLATSTLSAQKAEDYLGVNRLKFNGEKYQLGWSARNSRMYMQEFFPENQNPETYTDMFTISVDVAPQLTPQLAVQAKEAELSQRKEKKKDVWNWATCSSPDGTEWIIDFICCSGSQDSLEIVEFDVHRYRMIEVDGHPALQLLFYSHRAYGDDIMPFMKEELADLRKKSLNALIEFKVDCKALQK